MTLPASTSVFGGRGSAYSALLGILVIQSISSGLSLLSRDSSIQYMVTGAVLLLGSDHRLAQPAQPRRPRPRLSGRMRQRGVGVPP